MEDQADQQHPAGHHPALQRARQRRKANRSRRSPANLPKSENRRVFDMVTKKYWWHAWWWVPQAIIRGGIDKVHSAIEVKAAA